MGAHDFSTTAMGKTADEAYRNACEEARARNGHSEGYSGDIQTTCGFVVFASRTTQQDIDDLVDTILQNPRNLYGITKWGKAGCIELDRKEDMPPDQRLFLFFGIAAS